MAEALSLVLKSLNEQKTKYTFEVIIADDGSDGKTHKIIESFKEKSRYHIKHIWQDDDGYRLSKIVNKALIKTCGDYIILIDGDCVCPKIY